MIKKGISIAIIVLILSLSLTGCWDKIEIDERGFVLGLGIDLHDPEGDEPLLVTFVLPNPSAVVGEADEHNIILVSPGMSIYSTLKRMGMRASKSLYLGHLKVAVLGEDLIKEPKLLREVFDSLEKDPHVSRKVNLAVADGEARKALEIKTSIDPDIIKYITNIFELGAEINRAPLEDIDSVFYQFHRNGNGIITRLVIGEEDLKAAGAAVFKHFEFIDFIGEEVNRGLMFLRDKAIRGGFNIEFEGNIIPLEITDTKTKYSLFQEGDDIKIIVDVTLEGDIRQHTFNPDRMVMDPSFIEELQEMLAQEVKANMRHSLNVFQNQLRVDVIGFDDYIKRRHPRLWREIREDYDDIFPELDIVINVDSKIRRIGLSK